MLPYILDQVQTELKFQFGSEEAMQEATEKTSLELVRCHKQALRQDIARKHEFEMERVRIQRETEERKQKRGEMRVLRKAW